MKLALLVVMLGVSACAGKKQQVEQAQQPPPEPLILCLVDQHDNPLTGAFLIQAGGDIQFTDALGCAIFSITRKVLIAHPEIEDEPIIDPGSGFRIYRLHRLFSRKHRPA